MGSVTDITENEQLEENTLKLEDKYRTIMEDMKESYYEIDLDGNFTFFSDALCRQLGYSREELMGMNYRVFTPPENIKKQLELYKQVYRTGNPNELFSMEQTRKDGKRIFTESSVFPLRNEKEEIVGFRGIGRDVTEHVQMEEALKRSEERYRAILEEIEEGYYEVDLAGNFTFANDAACCQFGYSREELMGMNYRAYVPKDDAKNVNKTWNKVYRTGEPVKSFPFASIKKDGTHIYLENSISPLRNKEGKIIGFRSVSRDITERRQFEQKLAEMATHDSLTGLPNRVLLSDRLMIGSALARRSGHRLAVLMLDLDRFKTVNDAMGHSVGDELLKAVGQRLSGIMRKSDTVSRIGGDEFVLVLPQISQIENVTKFAERILNAFQEPFVFGRHRLQVTTSIGIAIYPEDGTNIENLLKSADSAMYLAKEQGRGIYKYYQDDETRSGDKADRRVRVLS
ncbi:MAG: PAS domain S-box protein [Dehalococcoidia bacterium]|nr:PAS domain S-box protein [Dehalococcoidia bacterium]